MYQLVMGVKHWSMYHDPNLGLATKIKAYKGAG
jgi:hypothetical protein